VSSRSDPICSSSSSNREGNSSSSDCSHHSSKLPWLSRLRNMLQFHSSSASTNHHISSRGGGVNSSNHIKGKGRRGSVRGTGSKRGRSLRVIAVP
jgi:hypothetical protein